MVVAKALDKLVTLEREWYEKTNFANFSAFIRVIVNLRNSR